MRARDSVVHVCNPDTQKPEARKQSSGWGKFHSESRVFIVVIVVNFYKSGEGNPSRSSLGTEPPCGLLKGLGQCWPLSSALSCTVDNDPLSEGGAIG